MSDRSSAKTSARSETTPRRGTGEPVPQVSFTVDGRPAMAPAGTCLLQALREMGVHVPTLCHHSSLEPSGACRLCVVDITHPDWGGWSGLVTSCLYAVEPGLVVSTRSERVRQTRRTLLQMYLARCPDSDVVRAVARDEGVDDTPFAIIPGADLCIHCGLCTRVCQELGPAAIAPLGRGTEKVVGPRPDLVGEDCTACMVCEHICPTGEIHSRHADGKITIWNREFPVPVCSVEPSACRGCGVCEEVCPFAIPRVTAYRSGAFVANISPLTCVGCGICAGACPTGAIGQEEYTAEHLAGGGLFGTGWSPEAAAKAALADSKTVTPEFSGSDSAAADLAGRAIVYACSRSPLPDGNVDLIFVPCIGRVTVEDMLLCLARGADGVLLMCRDQATCPYGDGGCQGEQRAAVAEQLAQLVGLGEGRVQYVQPDTGLPGPLAAANDFRRHLGPNPLQETYSDPLATGGLDLALAVLAWLKSRPELQPELPNLLAAHQECTGCEVDVLFYLGNLSELDLLLSLLVPDWRLHDIIVQGISVLHRRGLKFQMVLSPREIEASTVGRLVLSAAGDLPELNRDVEIETLAELAKGLSDTVTDPTRKPAKFFDNFKFKITHEERLELVESLKATINQQLVLDCQDLAQIKLLTRSGSWRESLPSDPVVSFTAAADKGPGETTA